jgi:ABC-type branched-subunit amino acid transport system substrate-binding protein
MPKHDETVFNRKDWRSVTVWESITGEWSAAAVKERGNGERDSIAFRRLTKEAAMDALLAGMKWVDSEDRLAEKIEAARAAIHSDYAK